MDLNPQDFFSIKEVLADVQVILDDEDNKLLTPGFYVSQVKYGLDELGFDIDFLPQTNDYPIPSDLILDMPFGCFNLKAITLYTGTPDAVGYTEDVHWRKGVQTRGKETGVTAGVNTYNVTDPFFRCRVWESGLYYFSVQNGMIRLSDACASFPYVRLTYSGIPSRNLDTVRMVPPMVRKAICDWVTARCAGALKMKDQRYRTIQSDAMAQLDEYGMYGSWHEAKMRLLQLDQKKLKDTILYNSKLNA